MPELIDSGSNQNRYDVEVPRDISMKVFDNSKSLNHAEIVHDRVAIKSLNGVQIDGVNPASSISLDHISNLQSNKSLEVMYSQSTIAKLWAVASKALNMSAPPELYPEYTDGSNEYVYREKEFWTSGFFPASLYLLLYRRRRYALRFPPPHLPHLAQLEHACKWWTLNLHQNAHLKDTHDLGFMVLWARSAWKLDGDLQAFKTLISAAQNLASRFNRTVGSLRSWDTCITKIYSHTDPAEDFLVIIDNMLNIDLLFWAADQLHDQDMYEKARKHAETTRKHHVRSDFSTFHVVNYEQADGSVKAKFTNQGYSTNSCWTRGQAWAITGFAQTFHWTKDKSFLETARGCANYFLDKLPTSGIPPWDFLAPQGENTPTDTSAAVIAAYGMLLLHEQLVKLGEDSSYLKSALFMLGALCCSQYLTAPAHFETSKISVSSAEYGIREESGPLMVSLNGNTETILLGATINNFEFAPRRWANHGLVYADYYFLLCGNKLLDMGIDLSKTDV